MGIIFARHIHHPHHTHPHHTVLRGQPGVDKCFIYAAAWFLWPDYYIRAIKKRIYIFYLSSYEFLC